MANEQNGVLDLSRINADLGLDDDYADYSNQRQSTNIQDKDVDQVKKIINTGNPTGLNQQNQNNQQDAAATPDYMKEYEEPLKRSFDKLDDPTINYSKKAIELLGPEYANISNRDDFETQLHWRQSAMHYIENDPQIKEISDIIDGVVPPLKVLRDVVSSRMDKYDVDYEENLEKRMAQYLEDGTTNTLNPKGQSVLKSIVADLEDARNKKYNEAKGFATKEVNKFKELRQVLSSEIKNFKPGGVELPDEMGEHLISHINSGKVEEWVKSTPTDAKEAAQKQILLAIISDPTARAHWIKMLDERGQTFGATKKAKQLFVNN